MCYYPVDGIIAKVGIVGINKCSGLLQLPGIFTKACAPFPKLSTCWSATNLQLPISESGFRFTFSDDELQAYMIAEAMRLRSRSNLIGKLLMN